MAGDLGLLVANVRVDRVQVEAFRFPTESASETDGTASWSATTMLVVHISASGATGLGYSYTHAAAARVVDETFKDLLMGTNPFDIPAVCDHLRGAVRNVGLAGIAAGALSAVDVALWDLKAHLLGIPLSTLLGKRRRVVPLYASGGFTNYTLPRLQRQLETWSTDGFRAVKMKIGADPSAALARVRLARSVVGSDIELMVDANGAYSVGQAASIKARLAEYGVTWFEEPVSSNDTRGLRQVREQAPRSVQIAAGEYGWTPQHQLGLLNANCVDVMQIDATRCLGISGFLVASAVTDTFEIPISAHTAPAIHVHLCAAIPRLLHVEYFHDHVRLEERLFEGVLTPKDGHVVLDNPPVGHGLSLRRSEAEDYAL